MNLEFFVDLLQVEILMATSEGGVCRIDDPSADRPGFRQYTPADGLSSNDAWCITEDRSGLIYLGTGRGVDRLNPRTGSIVRYSTADGLVGGEIRTATCDRQGTLWFGGAYGLSRLVPEPEKPERPPAVFVRGIRVAGVWHPLSEFVPLERYCCRLQTERLNPERHSPSFHSVTNRR